MHNKGISRFSEENLLSHKREKLRKGTFLYFGKYLVSKIFMDKKGGREGASIMIIRKYFLSHIAEKIGKGTF